MSAQNWAEYGIGLVLTSEEKIGDVDEIEYLLNKLGEEPEDIEENHSDKHHLWRYYNEEWEGKTFHSFTTHDSCEPKYALVIYAEKELKPFEAVYTHEEIIKEFKDILGEFLPSDFDWDAHIGTFSCTIYC